jgi:diguanylate cyclase (GGDEF)-like protein
MVTAVVAAFFVLGACGLAVLAVRRSRQQAERRLELVLDRIGSHLDAISAGVEQAVVRVVEAQSERIQPLTLDFDALVEELVAEAAARTGADAVVLRVEGPGGRPVLASFGHGADSALLDQTVATSDTRPFRAATIDWTYSASGDPEDELFHSALVAPLGPVARIPGTLVAYATAPQAFRPEHATVLQELIAEVATGLANARRFADVEARLLLDPATGIASRRGYEVELGREVARAHRTGRALSVVLVGIGNGTETTTTGGGSTSVDQVAQLLTRVTRRSDISCRRGDREFAILLPETKEAGAAVLTARLRDEAKRALAATQSSIAVGHVEWLPAESAEALEARAEAALRSPPDTRSPSATTWARRASAGPSSRSSNAALGDVDTGPTDALRRDVLDTLAREILDASRFGRSLAVVVLDIDGLGELSEDVDRESADAVLGNVAQRLSDSVGSGSVHRLGSGEFALVLSGATADDAEALLGSLHAPGDDHDAGAIVLSAGITEHVERDGAETVLGRAEHALWQAKQAGRGTIVVAVPGRRTPRFE